MRMERMEFDDAKDGELVETQWDLKKIVIGLVVLVVLFIGLSYVVLPNKERPQAQTLGVAIVTTPTPALPDKQDVENIISSARETLAQITSDNLTSSQAAIQKMISDLGKLKENKGAVGAICSLLCSDK